MTAEQLFLKYFKEETGHEYKDTYLLDSDLIDILHTKAQKDGIKDVDSNVNLKAHRVYGGNSIYFVGSLLYDKDVIKLNRLN